MAGGRGFPLTRDEPALSGDFMLIAALTGGIACGKSTVARMLVDLGAHLIDHDRLSRLVVEPGKPAWRDIVDCFGPGVLRADNTLDRAALGNIVFSDPHRRGQLERFVHPRILEEQERLVAEVRRRDPAAVVVVDVPLLYEAGLENRFACVILVYAPPELQVTRLMARDGFSRREAEDRLKAQMPIDEKAARADLVIRNDGDLAETRRRVEEVYRELTSGRWAKRQE